MDKKSTGAIAAACLLPCAFAQSPPAAERLDTVHIFGTGQTRQVHNITRADLAAALPGASPLKILQKLPGMSFQSADAFGSYEWSTRLSVRGFSQGQLGFTLDGIPLGNMSYGNNNGLHISRAIIPENIRRVDLSQGSGAVGTASTSNLGGTVQFFSSDPQDSFGVAGSLSAGSHGMRRSYARIDSGLLGTGLKASASAVRQHALKWKGDGPQDLSQLNLKAVLDKGPLTLSAFYHYADRSENDYQDLSLEMRERLGWDWDNYAPDWERALQAARGVFTGRVTSVDDAYFTARGLRKDHLAGAEMALENADASVQLAATVYYHRNDGQGHWYTPYTPTSQQVPISIRTTEYGVRRHGVLAGVTWNAGAHTLNAGLWFEQNTHALARNFYAANAGEDSNRFLAHPMITGFRQDFQVRTLQLHLEDTLVLMDGRLHLNAGVKHPRVRIDTASINAERAAGTLEARTSLLPQAGVKFDLGHGIELFASAARNMRAFEAGVYGQFSQNQEAFDGGAARLRPETSISADLGWRFARGALAGSVALYRADFRDRLLSVATCAGVVGCPNTVINAGRVATRGMEAAASWTFAPRWTWFNSATLNRSRYRSDYLDGGELVPVGGRRVVDAPSRLAQTELAFDDKRWFARLGAKYTGERYYTFVNDGRVPGYTVWDLAGGIRHGAVTVQVHVANLLGKRYFGTIGSNQFSASDPHGRFQTLLAGAPREMFITVSGKL